MAEPGPRDGDELALRAPEDLPRPPEPPPRRPFRTWILPAVVLAAGAGAAYVYFANRQAATPVAPATATTDAAVDAQPAGPLGADVTPIDLPPLDQSDPVIRTLVRALSSHPRVVAWLATTGLVRNVAVVIANIAEGQTPARHLQTLRLSSPFQVTVGARGEVGDPRNFQRYDSLAAAVASIDPAAAARLYASIKPRLEEAYRELGHPDTPFDRTLERAIVVLLETPAPDAAALLTRAPKGDGYRFVDQRLEALSDAQKQLLRAGPANVLTVQSWLREVASALGIPEQRLPARVG